jgi:hypothetical protein
LQLRRVATLCWETGETARIKLSAKRAEISQELSADSVTKKSCASAFSEEDEGTVIAFFKKAETIVDLMSSMKGGATLPEFEALKVLTSLVNWLTISAVYPEIPEYGL